MEILAARRASATKALARFQEALDRFSEEDSSSVDYHFFRDAVIQRFEFTFEIFWKFLGTYLSVEHGIVLESFGSRRVFRECLTQNILTIEERNQCMNMVGDRNRTSHTYEEELAENLVANLPQYAQLMRSVLDRTATG